MDQSSSNSTEKYHYEEYCHENSNYPTRYAHKPKFKFKRCGCNRKRKYLNEFNECNKCEKCKRCNDQRRDYLNEFQICNSCCKQMEKMTPSGFKPNVEFEKCEGCNQRVDYLNEFNE